MKKKSGDRSREQFGRLKKKKEKKPLMERKATYQMAGKREMGQNPEQMCVCMCAL